MTHFNNKFGIQESDRTCSARKNVQPKLNMQQAGVNSSSTEL